MTDTVENLMLDLVEWVARKERTYAETMDAWRTSCPKLPVWEDATGRGFVETNFVNGTSLVRVTQAGFDFLKAKRPHCHEQLRRETEAGAAQKHHDATEPVLHDFAQEWINAWNAHDLDRILSHYSEDVEICSLFVTSLTGRSESVLRGKAALRDYFARGLQAYPKLRFDFIRVYAGVQSCVVEYHSVNGMRTAELMEFDEQGKVRRVLAHYADEPQDGLRG